MTGWEWESPFERRVTDILSKKVFLTLRPDKGRYQPPGRSEMSGPETERRPPSR